MVKKELTFSDGTHIFYEEKNGRIQRFIEYSYTSDEEKMINVRPVLKQFFDSRVRKHNAGKYYYLKNLYAIVCELDDPQRLQLYCELKELHDKVSKEYDPSLDKIFLRTFGKYWNRNEVQCAAFFATIYLAMLDLEASKDKYSHSLGKTIVLRSCEAVILENKDPKQAAVMFERKEIDDNDDYDDFYSCGWSRRDLQDAYEAAYEI